MSFFQTSSSANCRIPPPVLSAAILVLLIPINAFAGPAEEHGLFKTGEGSLKRFGMSIYTAQLWTGPDVSQGALYERPVMLRIVYDWNVSRDRILKATRDEWKRLDGELDSREVKWLDDLAEIYPNIRSGEKLSSLVIPNSGTRFYLDDNEIGRIDDADFGQSFLAIWLDENTRDSRLRDGLLNRLPAT